MPNIIDDKTRWCRSCAGTGCGRCDGTGKTARPDNECRVCDGSGQDQERRYNPDATCPACRGEGHV